MDRLKEWKKAFSEVRENLSTVKSQFSYGQKIRIAELANIYPIRKVSGDIVLWCIL